MIFLGSLNVSHPAPLHSLGGKTDNAYFSMRDSHMEKRHMCGRVHDPSLVLVTIEVHLFAWHMPDEAAACSAGIILE